MTAAHDAPPPGRLNGDRLNAVLIAACRKAGLDPSGARLLKFTNNAVFRLPREPVVVRIAGSATMRNRVPKVLRVARWLAGHHFPAVRPLEGVDQPLIVDGELVTLWQEVPDGGPPVGGAELGNLLRQLHRLAEEHPVLPAWNPLGSIRSRLADAEGVGSADHDRLIAACAQVESALSTVTYQLPCGVIHGDATVANLIASRDGAVMCDFDATSIGPREWDLTPVAAGHLRFHNPGNNQALLAEAYGFDVTNWSGFSVLRRLRELQLVTSVVPVLRSNPNLYLEWRHRLETFLLNDTTRRWALYT